MRPNPYMQKLGYSATDRVVIIHTDDIGMCHASVQAFQDLWTFGTITSGATMVPCPWFPAVARMCRENPDIDFVLHPSIDTLELRAIAPDCESRVANYNVFMSDALKTFLEREDFNLIGYRHIRKVMRNG